MFSGKVMKAYKNTMLLLSQFFGRLKSESEQIHVQNSVSDEVDEVDNSDNEGSVEQEIRLSVSTIHLEI